MLNYIGNLFLTYNRNMDIEVKNTASDKKLRLKMKHCKIKRAFILYD